MRVSQTLIAASSPQATTQVPSAEKQTPRTLFSCSKNVAVACVEIKQ